MLLRIKRIFSLPSPPAFNLNRYNLLNRYYECYLIRRYLDLYLFSDPTYSLHGATLVSGNIDLHVIKMC